MKTPSKKIKSILFLLGVTIIYSTMTSCSSGKNFTNKMKYTHYKKVKAVCKKDSTINIASVGPEKEKSIVPLQINVQHDSCIMTQNVKITDSVNSIRKTKSSSVIALTNNTKSASAPEIKKNQMKKIFTEKIKRFTSPRSNLKKADNGGGKIFLTILIVLLVIILVYILITLLIMGLFEAAGGFAIGC